MFRRYAFVLFALGALFWGCEVNFASGSLPLVVVETEGVVRPDEKVAGTLEILHEGRTVLRHRMGTEYRGSTSYRLSDKKSYGIEFWTRGDDPRDVAVLGMPEESDWILMGHVFRATGPEDMMVFDPSLMHHYIGYELSRAVGRYAARCQWVELEFNGSYDGVYLLMERLKTSRWRIDIDEASRDEGAGLTGGYHLKIDKTAGNAPSGQPLSYYESNWHDDAYYTSANSFRSPYDVFGEKLDSDPFGPPYHPDQWRETYYLFESPGPFELSFAQRNYITRYVWDFERAVADETFDGPDRAYLDYIDLPSFVDFFLLNELAGNIDAYRISTNLYKPRGGKLHMGPIWDLNIGYGREPRVPVTDWIARYNQYVSEDAWMVPFYWEKFLSDPVFQAAVKVRWQEVRAEAWSTSAVLGLVDDTADRLRSTGAYDRNYDRWRASNAQVDYDSAVEFLKDYLRNRLQWMDSEISQW